MKSDIDRLMIERDVDAILVFGSGQNNPAMVYLTGGGHFSDAILIIQKRQAPILVHNSMERDEAARTGLQTISFANYPFNRYLEISKGDSVQALAEQYIQVLADSGVLGGRIVVYGIGEIGIYHEIMTRVKRKMPLFEIMGYLLDDILSIAMQTKEAYEVDRIRKMGLITTEVVAQTAEFLSSRKVENEILLDESGHPLTIGQVKNRINLWLAERMAENPEGTIFAQGRDAGVPHSTGINSDVLRLGQSIVFDIFPCEQGGGYYYDFTRTWSLGYATDQVQHLYDQVQHVYDNVVASLAVGEPFGMAQEKTCNLFEEMGHPTVKTNPQAESGYIHSVGHGLGLKVHEKPFSKIAPGFNDKLSPGSVFTIEPGLYYPDKGMGVRIEDTFLAKPDGTVELLAHYPYDLVIPMKSRR